MIVDIIVVVLAFGIGAYGGARFERRIIAFRMREAAARLTTDERLPEAARELCAGIVAELVTVEHELE